MFHLPNRLTQPRTLAVLGGTVGGFTIAFYLWVITNEDDNHWARVVGSVVILAIPCLLAFTSIALSARSARRMLTAAAIIFGLLGFLSVGPGFLLAAALTAIAAGRTVDSMTPTQID